MNLNFKEKGVYSTGRAVGDAAYLAVSVLIVKILGLIYKIPLAAYLGEEGMGFFNSAYTIYSFFYLLCTAGVPKAITLLCVNSETKETSSTSIGIIRVAIRVFLFIGIFLTLIFLFLSGPISMIIGNRGAYYTMLAISPSILFVSLTGVIRGYLNAKMKLIHVGISQIIEGVCRLVLGLVLARYAIKLGLSLEITSAMTILGVTLGSTVSFLHIFICSKTIKCREIKGQKLTIDEYINTTVKILSVSLPITLSSAVMSLGNLVDLSLIMKRLESIGYSESQASSLYGNYTTLAVPMFNFVISIITPLSVSFLPIFLKSSNAGERYVRLKDSLSITALITAPMIVGISCFSGEILSILFGRGPAENGDILLTLLMPAAFFSSLLLIVNSVLESLGSVRAPLIAMLVGGSFKLGFSFLMIGNVRFGISGAPISTVISYAVSLMISVLVLSSKHKLTVPILSTQIIPYLNAILSVFIAKHVYLKLVSIVKEVVSLTLTIGLCGLIYVILSLFSGTLNIKKINKIAKYTKITE